MAQIETSTLRVGSNDLILQDAQARQDISKIAPQVEASFATDTASGAIASFPDGADNVPVKSLTVDIEPVQDLHGYDSPWPAGGGKNLLPLEVSAIKAANAGAWSGNSLTSNGVTRTIQTDSAGNVVGIALNGTATAQVALVICQNVSVSSSESLKANGAGTGASNTTHFLNLVFSDGTNENVTSETTITGKTVTRALIYVRNGQNVNGIVYKPMIRLSSVSDATFAPYSNICPISGHTSAVVTRTGKNILPMTVSEIKAKNAGYWSGNSLTSSGITWTIQTDSDGNVIGISISGTASAQTTLALFTNGYVPCDSVRINGIGNGASNTTHFLNFNFSDGTNQNIISDTTITGKTAIDAYIFIRNGQRIDVEYKPMICSTSIADPTFAPYQGQTVTIDLGGTRYGGTLDVGTGMLTVDRRFVTLTANNVVAISGGNKRIITNLSDAKKTPDTAVAEDLISNMFAAKTSMQTYGGVCGVAINSDGNINVSLGYDVTMDTAKQYLTDNVVQLVYPLEIPFTVQLTANEITTLLGQNNIWNDCGDTEVEYRADTKLYIEKLTAPTEDDMIADHAISANTFFMVGNQLFRATTAIASGATITVGTNATKLSLSDALNALA